MLHHHQGSICHYNGCISTEKKHQWKRDGDHNSMTKNVECLFAHSQVLELGGHGKATTTHHW